MQDCCSHCGSSLHGFVRFGILCVDPCYPTFAFHQEEMTFRHKWYLLRDSRDITAWLWLRNRKSPTISKGCVNWN